MGIKHLEVEILCKVTLSVYGADDFKTRKDLFSLHFFSLEYYTFMPHVCIFYVKMHLNTMRFTSNVV